MSNPGFTVETRVEAGHLLEEFDGHALTRAMGVLVYMWKALPFESVRTLFVGIFFEEVLEENLLLGRWALGPGAAALVNELNGQRSTHNVLDSRMFARLSVTDKLEAIVKFSHVVQRCTE